MEYQLLPHLYYENKDEYNQLYEKRFHGESTVHLDFSIHDNPAYYCLCPEIHQMYIDILRLNQSVLQLMETLPGLASKQFAKRSLVEEIVLTNNIEGVYSTRREIDGILNNLKGGNKNRRFFGLVNKYNMLSHADVPLNTCEDIRKIYDELVLNEVAEDARENIPDGEIFRKGMAEITTVTDKVIHKGVFPESEIIKCMNQALKILNSNLPAVERIAIFHYLFGFIHPFYDGNGRTSRFISSYMLSKLLRNNLIGYRLSYTIKVNINDYYKAFKICNNVRSKGDITPFIITFMEIIRKSFENLESALSRRLNSFMDYLKKISTIKEFAREDINTLCSYLIQAQLFSEQGITKRELCSLMRISTATLDHKIDVIRKAGFLCEKKIGRTLYFNFNVEML